MNTNVFYEFYVFYVFYEFLLWNHVSQNFMQGYLWNINYSLFTSMRY